MKKFIVIILVVFSLGGMYYFSSQNVQVSGNQSQAAVKVIDKIRDKVTLQDENLIKIQTKVYDKLKRFGSKNYIVRKMAHFSIYAFYDEHRQSSIPGRAGSIKDVFIDLYGALSGIILTFIIILTIKILISLFKNLLNIKCLSEEEFNN